MAAIRIKRFCLWAGWLVGGAFVVSQMGSPELAKAIYFGGVALVTWYFASSWRR